MGCTARDVPRALGYDLAYQADLDTARDPATLQGRRAILVAGHNEYWAKAVRDGFDRARAAGTSLAFFGANARTGRCATRRTSAPRGLQEPRPGIPRPTQLETDLFRALVPPRYECGLIGIQHQGGDLAWPVHGDYTVLPGADDAWLKAAGLAPGDAVKGIVSREVDTIPGHLTAADSCGNKLTVLFHRARRRHPRQRRRRALHGAVGCTRVRVGSTSSRGASPRCRA